jgi:hypothetical protein
LYIAQNILVMEEYEMRFYNGINFGMGDMSFCVIEQDTESFQCLFYHTDLEEQARIIQDFRTNGFRVATWLQQPFRIIPGTLLTVEQCRDIWEQINVTTPFHTRSIIFPRPQ